MGMGHCERMQRSHVAICFFCVGFLLIAQLSSHLSQGFAALPPSRWPFHACCCSRWRLGHHSMCVLVQTRGLGRPRSCVTLAGSTFLCYVGRFLGGFLPHTAGSGGEWKTSGAGGPTMTPSDRAVLLDMFDGNSNVSRVYTNPKETVRISSVNMCMLAFCATGAFSESTSRTHGVEFFIIAIIAPSGSRPPTPM